MYVEIAGRRIGPGYPCYVIAEIGGNFVTFEEGARLIDAAKRAGADAVKLQTYRADTLSSKKAMFDMENTGVTSQYELFRRYELSEEMHRQIFAYAREQGICCFSTPSHESDVELLERFDVPAHKIGSDDAWSLPFLRIVARTRRPIILSTGMCTLSEVRESVDTILGEGNDQLVVLHCVTNYPCHPENVNLRAMQTMARELGVPVGFSDHTIGIAVPTAAAALGAVAIEKHFTLDKNAEGPDHMLSLDPEELATLVSNIRAIEAAMGDGVKRPARSEAVTRRNNRKSVVATCDIPRGATIAADMVAIKRPGLGIPPKYLDEVIGRTARVDIPAEEALTWEMV